MSENCVDVRNYEAVRTIFTEKQQRLKSLKHPELREANFIERVRDTIQHPEFVYGDLAGGSRLVYYRYEYSVNGRARYTKVVVEARKTLCFVVTAFRPDFVKERGKVKCVYGEDKE